MSKDAKIVEDNYIPYGPEWEKEMMKLTKKLLIDMVRKIKSQPPCTDVGEVEKPKVVCLYGSTRFSKAFQDANLNETMNGNIVLSIGCNMKSDMDIFGHLPEAELKQIKINLDELHKRKIDLADEVFVLNVGGYIGDSTRSEIEYAIKIGKPVLYLEKLTIEQKDKVIATQQPMTEDTDAGIKTWTDKQDERDKKTNELDEGQCPVCFRMNGNHFASCPENKVPAGNKKDLTNEQKENL